MIFRLKPVIKVFETLTFICAKGIVIVRIFCSFRYILCLQLISYTVDSDSKPIFCKYALLLYIGCGTCLVCIVIRDCFLDCLKTQRLQLQMTVMMNFLMTRLVLRRRIFKIFFSTQRDILNH